jgi:O-antigen/teichoic acid export membrane protein
VSRRRLRNVLSLLGGNAFARVVSLLYVMLVARVLGLEGFGQLAIVTAYVAIFGTLSDAGLTTLVVRDVAREPALARCYLVRSLLLRVGTAGLAYAALVGTAAVTGSPSARLPDFWIGGLVLIPAGVAGSFQAILTAREQMGRVSLMTNLVGVVTLVSAWPVLRAGGGVRGLLMALVLATALQAAVGAGWVFHARLTHEPGPGFAREPLWRFFRRAWPYAGFGILSTVYVRAATVLLSVLGGPEAAGVYVAAFRLVEAFTVMPLALMGALFPLMAVQSLAGVAGPLGQTYGQAVRVLGLLALPLAVGTTLVAAPVVLAVYGTAYAGAAGVLAVLVWGLALLFLNAPVGNVILSSNLASRFLPWAALHTGGSVLLTAFLALRFGPLGAAWAFVAAELTGFGLQLWFIRPLVGQLPSFPRVLARPVVAAAVMGAVVGGSRALGASLWVVVPAGILVYFGGLLALREVRAEDRARVRAWLGRTRLDAPVGAGERGGI